MSSQNNGDDEIRSWLISVWVQKIMTLLLLCRKFSNALTGNKCVEANIYLYETKYSISSNITALAPHTARYKPDIMR